MFLEELKPVDDVTYLALCMNKISLLKSAKETMENTNEYFEKQGTLKRCPFVNYRIIPELEAGMQKRGDKKPFAAVRISNLDAQIHRLQMKVKELGNKGKYNKQNSER